MRLAAFFRYHLIPVFENTKLAVGVLRTQRLRAGLATLGVLIGLTTILLMVTIIQGLNRALGQQLAQMGSATLYVDKFAWTTHEPFWMMRNRPDLTRADADALRGQSQYAVYVAPTVMRQSDIEYRDQRAGDAIVVGTTAEYRETSNSLPATGRFITDLDVRRNRYVCVLGSEVAETLFHGARAEGHDVRIGGCDFEVAGVLEKKGRMFDFSLDNRVVVPIGAFYKVYGSHRSVTIETQVAGAAQVEEARDEITGILRRRRGLGPEDRDNFAVNDQSAILNVYHQMTSRVYAAGIGISSIALLVGGIGIMNIMLVSVSERTREIGIRKALGARRAVILGQFLIEAIMICAGGGVLGIALAWGIARALSASTPLPTSMPLWVMLLGLGFSSGVGLVFGLLPAARAARLDPVEALRYE